RIEADDGVAEVRAAVPRRVPGRDEDLPVRLVDDGARAAEDRAVARAAARWFDQAVPVRAERVPDVQELAARGVEDRDVALVRRRIADVAARRRDHVAAPV